MAAVGAVLAITMLAAGCQPAPTTDAYPDNGGGTNPGWFQAGVLWQGDFGDPTVVREGNVYYAYSSPTGGRYLPVLTSTDLQHWLVHANWSPVPQEILASNQSDVDKRNLNDGLVKPASWGQVNNTTGPWINRDLWAPGVIKIGSTWFAYHAVRVSNAGDDPNNFGRFCLTVASATAPAGPFRDISGNGPIQCQDAGHDPSGSIDPSPYFDPSTNKYYLLWKAAGMIGVRESALMAVELGSNGFPVPGANPVDLLETNRADPWEGGTIENPSKVTFNGWTYLFYSGNSSLPLTANNLSVYATGYAICYFGPTAPCSRVQSTPLIKNFGDVVQGPGGSSGFVTADNQLRVAYAYYWAGETRVPAPRRMKIAKIVQNPADGTLTFDGNV